MDLQSETLEDPPSHSEESRNSDVSYASSGSVQTLLQYFESLRVGESEVLQSETPQRRVKWSEIEEHFTDTENIIVNGRRVSEIESESKESQIISADKMMTKDDDTSKGPFRKLAMGERGPALRVSTADRLNSVLLSAREQSKPSPWRKVLTHTTLPAPSVNSLTSSASLQGVLPPPTRGVLPPPTRGVLLPPTRGVLPPPSVNSQSTVASKWGTVASRWRSKYPDSPRNEHSIMNNSFSSSIRTAPTFKSVALNAKLFGRMRTNLQPVSVTPRDIFSPGSHPASKGPNSMALPDEATNQHSGYRKVYGRTKTLPGHEEGPTRDIKKGNEKAQKIEKVPELKARSSSPSNKKDRVYVYSAYMQPIGS